METIFDLLQVKITEQPRIKKYRICADCKYHLFYGDIWYHQFCTGSTKKKVIDCVTGDWGYTDYENYTACTDNHPYRFCRDVNQNGECDMYVKCSTVSEEIYVRRVKNKNGIYREFHTASKKNNANSAKCKKSKNTIIGFFKRLFRKKN